MSKKEDDL